MQDTMLQSDTDVRSDRGAYRPARPYEMQIGGEPVSSADHLAAIDPSTGEEWAQIPVAAQTDVTHAVSVAASAFKTWRTSTPATRQDVLWQMADRLRENPDRWACLLATENGRPLREASSVDLPTSAAILRYFAGLARAHKGDQIPVEARDSLVYAVREPLGVIAALIPWNSPLISLANKIGPALATGNTVVIKPSELASASVLEFIELMADLVPPGVLNVVTGGPEVGGTLVADARVAKISFTGGSATARHIMSAAAQALTPAIMELGGKGAMIVCRDADLDAAVHDAAAGIYLSNGEVCVAASRILVHEDVREPFLERFAALAATIRVGDALDPKTQLGPLVSTAHRDRVVAAVETASEQGARVAVGGAVPNLGPSLAGGAFVEPTLLDDPAGATRASSEEIFGPVTVLETWRDEDDAVARANSTPYGLATGVWTQDLRTAHRIARALESGIVWVNTWFDLPVGAPMGGVRDSGFGRELSAETLGEYSSPKVININLSPDRPRLWGASA